MLNNRIILGGKGGKRNIAYVAPPTNTKKNLEGNPFMIKAPQIRKIVYVVPPSNPLPTVSSTTDDKPKKNILEK
jgi:hypothetical protein